MSIVDEENTVDSLVTDGVRGRFSQNQEQTPLIAGYNSISNEHSDSDDDDGDISHLKASWVMILVALGIYASGQALIIAGGLDAMTQLICYDHFEPILDPIGMPVASEGWLSGSIDKMLQGTDPQCRSPEISGLVASFSANRLLITGTLGIIVTPRLSELSDRFGRRPIMMWAAFASVCAEIISLICMLFPGIVNYRYLLLASFFQGSGGSIMTVQLLNSSYIVDCVPLKKRSIILGRLDSVMFGCLALGPLLGSILVGQFGSLVLLYICTLCATIVFGLIITVYLHESRPLKERRMSQAIYDERLVAREYLQPADLSTKVKQRSAQLLKHINIFRPVKVLFFNHIQDPLRRRNARTLAVMSSLGAEIALSVASTILIYSEMSFKWTSVEAGYLMTIIGTFRMLLLAFGYPLLVKKLRNKFGHSATDVDATDITTMQIGTIVHVFGYIMMANSKTGSMFVLATIFESGGTLMMPTMKSGLVKFAENGKVGELLGALGLANSVGNTIFPILFLKTYKATVTFMPNSVLYMGSVAFFGLWLLSCTLRSNANNIIREDSEDSDSD